MKNVTFQIEFTAKINDDVDPSDVTFDIDLARVTPQVESNGPAVGHVTGYTTTNAFTDSE